MLAGQLAVERNLVTEQELRVKARDEGDLVRPELIAVVRVDEGLLLAQPAADIRFTSELQL